MRRLCFAAVAVGIMACSGETPPIQNFDGSGDVPTATPTATATPTELEGPCAPELTGKSASFELIFDESFNPYYKLVFGYSNLCGEAQDGRVVAHIIVDDGSSEPYDETFHYFLNVENTLASVDASASTISVSIPVVRDTLATHEFSVIFYDTLGYVSNEITGEYKPGVETTPTETPSE